MNIKLRAYSPLGLLLVSIISGCGGEDGSEGKATESNNKQPTPQVTVSASDATFSTSFSEFYTVDLSSKVYSSDGSGFVLTGVEVLSENENCQVDSMSDSGFVIDASTSKVCNYRYSVAPIEQGAMTQHAQESKPMSEQAYSDGAPSSAVTRVAVSSNPNAVELTPISDTTLINTVTSVDIESKLAEVGITLASGFELTEITLPYGYSSIAEAEPTNDRIINYTPAPGMTGIDRVLYTYEDSSKGLVLMGGLDIAIGYEANQGFSIQDNAEYTDVIEVNTLTDINISDFVTSDDGDDYQLVYVESFDATVKAKYPLDLSNKLIEFKASEPGYYYVSFGVSDHNGTYDMGLIKVRVFDPNLLENWPDIYYGTYKYTAPITVAQAENELVQYDGAFLDDNGFLMSSFYANNDSAEAAVAYCGKLGGVVPTAQQLEVLGRDKLALDYDWPVSVKYMARNVGVSVYLYAVDLIDGESNRVYGSNLYVTCAIDNIITIDDADSDFEAIANAKDKAKISVNIASNNIPTVGALVSISTDSDYVSIDDPDGETDENGNISFFIDSVRSGIVNAKIDYDGREITQEIKFTADPSSANIALDVPANIISASDVVEISSTLKDGFNNDLVDETIDFKIDDPAEVTPNSKITYDSENEDFTANADITLPNPAPSVKGTAAYTSFNVTASYTLPAGDLVSVVEQIKYSTGIGTGIAISPEAVENCLADGVITQEYIEANCLTYNPLRDNFGFVNGATFIYFDVEYAIPVSITAYGYWRQSANYGGGGDEQNHNLGYWQLQGCNDDVCSNFDILIDRFGLSFEQTVPISTSKAYSRYRLVFVDGPTVRNGATGGGNFSEIVIGV